ncbi:vitamin K epoxide reductase family protein [Candidatus Saccharibacteria bacterium]|nr:vitamin K epoxide reductase family protein [Candidatus Saccharibacteria bacterium]
MIKIQKILQKYVTVLPIIFLFLSIFVLRSKVQYFYLLAISLVILLIVAQRNSKLNSDIHLAQWLLILSAIGLSASSVLSIEKIELLSQPGHVSSCSISPIVACSPIITSNQASAFGFANPFIGIFGFSAVFTAAMTILAGAKKLHKIWWRTLFTGIAFNAGFCAWLFYQGVFNIGKLCLYCMSVWLVTYAMFWLAADYCVRNRYISFGYKINKLLSYKYELIATTFAIIVVLLFIRWSDYWTSLL